jgi:molybdopterin converting factor small subunit
MRYWAAAREAAGVAEEIVDADTLAAALLAIRSRRDDGTPPGRPADAGTRRDRPARPAPSGPAPSGPDHGEPADRGPALSAVLDRSSFLIDGHPVGRRPADDVVLADGAVIEVLPPFAGG